MKIRDCLLAFILFLTGCKETILHDLDELQANRIVARLAEQRIQATKDKQPDGRWSISLDEADTPAALQFMEQARTLRPLKSAGGTESGLLGNREDQRVRAERAMSFALEETILNMSGVIDARIHLNRKYADSLLSDSRGVQEDSAAVLLVIRDEAEVSEEAVKSLVAGASGVPIERVAVVMDRTATTPQQAAPYPTPAGQSSVLVSRLANFESATLASIFLLSCLFILRNRSRLFRRTS